MAEPLDLRPPEYSVYCLGGDDVSYSFTIQDVDLSASDHALRIATTKTGEAIETLTDSDGIAVSVVDGDTRCVYTIDAAFTQQHAGETLYLRHVVTTGGADRTYATITMTIDSGVQA